MVRTVQATVESALGTVWRHPVALTVAGRTDAGVHAVGQVAHADVDSIAVGELRAAQRRVNAVLPDDARLLRLTWAPPGFDARFGALSRIYRYRLTDQVPDPLRRRDTVAWPRPLDTTAMGRAAEGLVGEHDFAAYCRPRANGTTVRRLRRLEVLRCGGDRDGLLNRDDVVEVVAEADAFCHHMVRGLVGALLAVGEGRRPLDWPAGLLDLRVRANAVTVAPAHGLTLLMVRYPPDEELADRAAVTRARREPRLSGQPGRRSAAHRE